MFLPFLRKLKLERTLHCSLKGQNNSKNLYFPFCSLNPPNPLILSGANTSYTYRIFPNFSKCYSTHSLSRKIPHILPLRDRKCDFGPFKRPFLFTLSQPISTLKRRKFKIKKHKKKKRKKRWSRMSLIPWRPTSDSKPLHRSPAKVRRIVKERRARNKGNRTLRAPRQR